MASGSDSSVVLVAGFVAVGMVLMASVFYKMRKRRRMEDDDEWSLRKNGDDEEEGSTRSGGRW